MHDHGRLASELPPLHRLALVETSIYAIAAESYGQQLFIERGRVRISRLSCTRKIVDVSSLYRSQVDFTEKFHLRVDVTEQFPFLVTKMSP